GINPREILLALVSKCFRGAEILKSAGRRFARAERKKKRRPALFGMTVIEGWPRRVPLEILGQAEVAPLHEYSQGLKEVEEGFLVCARKLSELFADLGSFPSVASDSVRKSERSAIVHQTRSQADSPERSGADFVAAALEVLLL